MAVKKPVKKPLKKKPAKKKPKATMSQSVRQTVIVNQPVATRKRKSKSKAKAKSKSDSEVIASLVDKFVNLSAEQAKINNTITQAKQNVKVEDIAPVKSAPVSKTAGLGDLELKKIKKADPIEPTGIEKIKRAVSLLETNGNILTHLSKKKPPPTPSLTDTIDSLSANLGVGLGKGGAKRSPYQPVPRDVQEQRDLQALMDQEEGGFVVL